MSSTHQRVVTVLVAVLLAAAAGRAATRIYQERQEAFRKECKVEREKLGLSAEELRSRYPTPEIRLMSAACIPPGSTADLVVSGRFAAGARFFVENDHFQVVKESAAGNEYRATVKASPGIGPEVAPLTVMNPVTAQSATIPAAVKMGGRYQWTMKAANGWKVVAKPAGGSACGPTPDASYDLSFFRPGEAAAFQNAKASLHFNPWSARSFSFALEQVGAEAPGVEDYRDLAQKLADPALTPAARDALMAQVAAAQERMGATIQKMTDPAYVRSLEEERKRQEAAFGCRTVEVGVEGGTIAGEMTCSAAVGRRLALSGTIELVGR